MGNCLKRSSADDISLLRGSSEPAISRDSFDQLGGPAAPPLYSEILQPVFYPSPSVSSRPVMGSFHQQHHQQQHNNISEEEQIKIAKRIGLIQHLPIGLYDGCKKSRECVICMVEFRAGDSVRYLPCMHTYHVNCIDDWLMRSLTCPSCMEPVDAALLTTYDTT